MIVLSLSIKSAFKISKAFNSLCDGITDYARDVRRSQERFNGKLERIMKEIGVCALGEMTLNQIDDYKPKF